MIRDVGVDAFRVCYIIIFIQFNPFFLNTVKLITVKNSYLVSTVNHPPLTYTSVRMLYDICNAAVFVIIKGDDSLLTFFGCGDNSILVVTWSRSYRKANKLCPCSKARVSSARINNQEVNQ
jgi:hypothetical protein